MGLGQGTGMEEQTEWHLTGKRRLEVGTVEGWDLHELVGIGPGDSGVRFIHFSSLVLSQEIIIKGEK